MTRTRQSYFVMRWPNGTGVITDNAKYAHIIAGDFEKQHATVELTLDDGRTYRSLTPTRKEAEA